MLFFIFKAYFNHKDVKEDLTQVCVQAEEAEATYRTCIADATTQHQELEDMKVNVLKQIQELIRQTDQILRAVRTPAFRNPQSHWFTGKCALVLLVLSVRSVPSHTIRPCTCRRLRCRFISRRCVRAVSCMIRHSSTPLTSKTSSSGLKCQFSTSLSRTLRPATSKTSDYCICCNASWELTYSVQLYI